MYSPTHQDFNQIVFRRHKPHTQTNSYVTREQATQRQLDAYTTSDEDTKAYDKHQQRARDFKKKLLNVRTSKKMNQKQFANFLNVKSDIIQKIESGSLIPDNALIQSISRKL